MSSLGNLVFVHVLLLGGNGLVEVEEVGAGLRKVSSDLTGRLPSV